MKTAKQTIRSVNEKLFGKEIAELIDMEDRK